MSKKLSMYELAVEVFGINSNNGWWREPDRNIGEVLALIHSEVSEALEDWRVEGNYVLNSTGHLGTGGMPLEAGYRVEPSGKPVGFWSEIADVIIRCLDLVGRYDIDIDTIIDEKLRYNRTRSDRHGGKHA